MDVEEREEFPKTLEENGALVVGDGGDELFMKASSQSKETVNAPSRFLERKRLGSFLAGIGLLARPPLVGASGALSYNVPRRQRNEIVYQRRHSQLSECDDSLSLSLSLPLSL